MFEILHSEKIMQGKKRDRKVIQKILAVIISVCFMTKFVVSFLHFLNKHELLCKQEIKQQ